MRIPGIKTMKMSTRWLRSRTRIGGLILGYHRVGEVQGDRYGMAVTPDHFQAQMAVLRKHAQILNLEDLIHGISQDDLPQKAAAVTFDDGYLDFHLRAMPVLKSFNIPATVFITTGYLGRTYWWDELEEILSAEDIDIPFLQQVMDDHKIAWESAPGNQGEQYQLPAIRKDLYNYLLELDIQKRDATLSQLRKNLTWDGAHPEEQRGMTGEEIRKLVESGLVSIGSHGVSHTPLEGLSPKAQEGEIANSKVTLEKLTNKPVIGFSYPHGSKNNHVQNLVHKYGYLYACASYNDIAWRGCGSYNLPRFWVPDWNGSRFERWLKFWLPG